MSVGDQYKFYIPAKLAYGNSSPEGSPIPPGSTLFLLLNLLNYQIFKEINYKLVKN